MKIYTLKWAQNTEAGLAGYRIYSSVDGGKTWTLRKTVTDDVLGLRLLLPTKTYRFAYTAFDMAGNEGPKRAITAS